MSELDRQTADLIAALESQLIAGLDPELADDLQRAIDQVKARRDAALRGDVQRAVGQTHLTLREAVDRVLDIQVDTRGLVAEAVRQLESQGAALDAARAEFHFGLGSVGERLSQLAGDVGAMSDDVAILKEQALRQERVNQEIAAGIDRLGARVAAVEAGQAALVGRVDAQDQRHAQAIAELSRQVGDLTSYQAGLPADERARLVALLQDVASRIDRLEGRT